MFTFHISHVISKYRRSSIKKEVHAISFKRFRAIKNVKKIFAEGEKVLVINEIAKGKTTKSISERIDLHVMTKKESSDMIFEKSFKKAILA